MIIFTHIPRSGGAKINQAILHHFPDRHIIFTGQIDVAKHMAEALAEPDHDRFLGGHVAFRHLGPFLASRVAGDILFSTTRDPLERAVSLYFLGRRSPSWMPRVAAFLDQGFAEFYAACTDVGVLKPNAQCVLLSGQTDSTVAAGMLAQHFDLVGTHRHYQSFLRQLENLLQPQVPGFAIDDTRINSAYHLETGEAGWQRRLPLEEVVDPTTRRRIEREHDQDYALVEYIEGQPDGVFRGCRVQG